MARLIHAGTVCRSAVATLLLLLTLGVANAHPNEFSAYSMRSLVRMSENGLHAMVLLEVPINDVMNEFRERLIETEQVDPGNIEQEDIDEFNRLQWERLAAGLQIKINGETPEGAWEPVDTPINGKANAGFFVYMLWFKPDQPDKEWGAKITVEIDNQGYKDLQMYLSGYADSREPWQVTENSAQKLLGEGALVQEANVDPKAWTMDEAMRHLRVVYTRAAPSSP